MAPSPFPPPVSIVIPNYNGEGIIGDGLAHAERALAAYPPGGEVVVVDDGSSDASVALIRGSYPRVRLLVHPENRGFAEAVHTGVAGAAHDLVLLLNSDVRVDADCIEPLVHCFADPDTFSAGPLVLEHDRRPAAYSWVRASISGGMVKKCTRWDPDAAAAAGRPLKALYASGGSVAFDRRKFDRLGGFLPCFKPFGGEDMDLGTRAWRHGWPTWFVPASRVVHDHRKSTIQRFHSWSRRRVVGRKNRYVFNWIHLPAGTLWLQHAPRLLGEILWGTLRLDFSYLLGLVDALRHLALVRTTRRALAAAPGSRPLRAVLAEIDRDAP